MADKVVTLREMSAPGDITFKLTDFRNEIDPDAKVDITGYAFKLVVKHNLDDPDTEVLFPELTGAIVTAADGTFKFTLTTAHTSMASGSYVGEIRWWATGAATGKRPTDAWSVDYVVQPAVRIAEP